MSSTFDQIERGTPAYRTTTIALFAAGFSIFALLYCVQPLLPELARDFDVNAATASLAVSLTTGCLALGLLALGHVAEGWGRKPLIVIALLAASILTVAAAAAPTWGSFLLVRALEGFVFAGLPAVAMAYIGEEIAPGSSGLAMGIYVAGTAFGGMTGRLVGASITEVATWRIALGAIGMSGLAAALLVATLLPASRHPHAHLDPSTGPGRRATALPATNLAGLYAQGFLFMGTFVAVYNYLTFRLVAPPYSLGHTAVGSIFVLYLVGMISSPWAGTLAGRLGSKRTLRICLGLVAAGLITTLAGPLPLVIAGVGLITFGFFAAHAVTSNWVSAAAGARRARGAALYLFFYYVGASVTGTAAGWFWERFGWHGVIAITLLQLVVALGLTGRLPEEPPARDAGDRAGFTSAGCGSPSTCCDRRCRSRTPCRRPHRAPRRPWRWRP